MDDGKQREALARAAVRLLTLNPIRANSMSMLKKDRCSSPPSPPTPDMSSEDLGAPAYRKFDTEAWMPGLRRYGEQPRNHLSRKKTKTTLPPLQFVPALNATACAVPGTIIAILENDQREDGSVVIPDALRPFMGGLGLIKPKSR
ncbi:unnamed protein product [Sphagnum tenellum]